MELALFCLLVWTGLHNGEAKDTSVREVVSVTFLVTVNDTWYPQEYGKTCLQTVKSPALKPNQTLNESETIHVGDCDYGPLTFILTKDYFIGKDGHNESHTYIQLTFYSHVIEDASPPTCKILWDYKYREPTTYGPKESLLPGCWVADSREGYHMTYYWFHVLDWMTV